MGRCRVKSKVQTRDREMPPFVLTIFIHLKTLKTASERILQLISTGCFWGGAWVARRRSWQGDLCTESPYVPSEVYAKGVCYLSRER